MKVPGSAIGYSKKGTNETNQLDFIGQVRDSNGRMVGGVRDQITVKLNEANAAQIDRRYMQYDSGLTLASGNYSLTFLAREGLGGKMGTFETKFAVPDLNSEKSLRVSSVILSSQREAISAAVGACSRGQPKEVAHQPSADSGPRR